MCSEKKMWDRVVAFHGHSCLGLAIGFRVAEAAMRSLGNVRDIDEEMVAIVENDSCAVDAIQVITGCTLGKGNLIYRDYGKQAYTFNLRKNGKAVRVTPKGLDEERNREIMALREKVAGGKAEEEEIKLLKSKTKELIEEMLIRPVEEVCLIQEINCKIPEKARIFTSIACSCCGEKVMEPRARVKDGKPVCIPCSEKYTRGWGEN
ncbi:MAG: FmdE family protein [Bacillota bacterium]